MSLLDSFSPLEALNRLPFAVVLFSIALVFGSVFLILKFKSTYNLAIRLIISFIISGPVLILLFIVFALINYGKQIFKEPPYSFTDFKSLVFKYGKGDSLLNSYNSATGEYDYLDARDSLVKSNVLLTTNDLLILTEKAAQVGFWNFPSREMNSDTSQFKGEKPPRYFIEFNYKNKSKKVLFDSSFDGDAHLRDANEQLVTEIMQVLADAQSREKK